MSWWLGGEPGAQGSLVWTTQPWVVLLAALAALAAWALSLRGARSPVARVTEAVAMALGLAGLVVAIARPVWVEEEGRTEPGRVAVLIDGSASMSVVEGGQPRHAAVPGFLDQIGSSHVELYRFGSELQPGAPELYDLPGTDVEAALQALSDRVAGEKLAAVVLISDGIDRGLLRRRFQKEENPVPPVLPGPLTTIQVGQVSELVDLAVREVDAGGYAYVHAPFHLKATLEGVGYQGREVKVDLLRDGNVVHSRKVLLDAAGQGAVDFEVTPDRAGRFAYIVQVPDYEGDAVPANNAMPVVVSVVRDRIRVLQVAGAPSWDVKFLRRFLKGDPSVDLVSFFILRTPRDNIRRFDERELSLIQFPYQELFSTELLTFDLVIFQNFDYRPYFDEGSDKLLDNLRAYVVDSGHAFVMTGGDRSFSLGAYGGTPLGDILPVRISTEPQDPDLGPFLPTLTEAGQRHPVTRLVSDPTENALWWSRLHTNDGTNMVGDAWPESAVLLEHPSLRTTSGRALPVLSVREVGLGRTMALTVDTSWRWSLSEAAAGRGNQAYLRFWKNAMRWLVGDASVERLSVDTGRENYGLGEQIRLVVRARNADFGALGGAAVHVVVSNDGERQEVDVVTDSAGEAVVELQAERRGAHRVEAKLVGATDASSETATVFAVTNRDPELDEVVPDGNFLRWLAERSQGRFVRPGEAVIVEKDPSAGRTIWTRKELAIWRAPIVALWVGVFLGAAWILRRLVGLR